MSRPPCRFEQAPGGCRRGQKCNFTHINNNSTNSGQRIGSPGPSTNGPPSLPNTPHRQTNSPTPSSSAPPGVCRFYWTTGSCKREFECRYRHTRSDLTPGTPRSPTSFRINLASQAAREAIAPFLTEKGLTKINGVATDGFFAEDDSQSLSPTDAHNQLKRFLFENFRFKNAFDVYAFLRPLCSANSSNTLWVCSFSDPLCFYLLLATDNGSLRIVDVINWPEVSTRAGSNRDVLSFQRGILPLLRYMSSEFVIKSTLVTLTNRLYTIVLQNLPKFADVIESCMEVFIQLRSFRDPSATAVYKHIDGQVFASLAGVLHEFLVRFKNAVATYPRLAPLIVKLDQWFQKWYTGISATPPLFDDPFKNLQHAVRDLILSSIKDKVERLVHILEREERRFLPRDPKKDRRVLTNSADPHEALIAALHVAYEGPGDLRARGRRHDNDLVDVCDIRVAPTNEELMCRLPPFLPGNFFSAPHPAPPDSMQRLLDIQFRLLREELTAPLRSAVQLVYDDLKSVSSKRTKLTELLLSNGGRYRGLADSQDSLMFNVYTGVRFISLVPDWRGISTNIFIDTPPGRARSNAPGKRAAFWESMSGKRLSQGGLVALIWESGGKVDVHLGVIASSSRDLADYVKRDADRIQLRIVFFDPSVELRVLQDLRNSQRSTSGVKLLVESSVMFEAIRPFLDALKSTPEDIPFSRYLVHQPSGQLQTCRLEPPQYARLPGFTFQLASLFSEDSGIEDVTLSVHDPGSIESARTALRKSRLDPSQADAVVDTLIREVALIQGPPGTGKSFTGVEILRVLKANKIGPILMIAFTNHALDHMLESVLDAHITDKIVRLGRRSNDERIAKYSIETLEMVQDRSRLDWALSHCRRELKEVQGSIADLMGRVMRLNIELDSAEIMKYLSSFHPEHHEYLSHVPPDVSRIKKLVRDDDENAGEWQRAGRGGKSRAEDHSNYAFWRQCTDLAFISQITNGTLPLQTPTTKRGPIQNAFDVLEVEQLADTGSDQDSDSDITDPEDDEMGAESSWKAAQYNGSPSEPNTPQEAPSQVLDSQPVSPDTALQAADINDLEGLLNALGFDKIPSVPSSDRPLNELLENVGDVWTMSESERRCIHRFWVEQARIELGQAYVDEFERLRTLHAEKLKQCNEVKEEVRRSLLGNIDIIGCTTTGAAQLTSLLKGLSPKVLLVEEAGQVMEAHILGSLVPSIEHLILIGDPLQLRPTLNNFALSMDNKRGRELFKFDMSLMERLSISGLVMSRIDVQRRMRPTISSLIRNTLYPGLEDHELVHHYPDVRGIQQNVFFVTHNHRENDGQDDTASKYNTYEVAMIADLVLYLLRQGCYSNEGDIVVLCAYLGQLARLRDALANEVAVIIDERDQAALDDQESDKDLLATSEGTVERVNVTKRVRLRTVDNYQGEEGRIVILSLVRNSGDPEDEIVGERLTYGSRPNIGFLKSENRTNVALSRAREGLFIFGNAENLASRSKMWSAIIEELEGIGCVGPALPIACHRHPETVEHVSKPGTLPLIAPDGGCLRPCETRLNCGHLCPFKCHSDDPNHITVVCSQPCRRLCPRNHPCRKLCSAACGQCHFSVANVSLPCGHIKASVECWQLDSIESVFCDFEVEKALPHCEHIAVMACGQEPENYVCVARCAADMGCCNKACNARCHECQALNVREEDGRCSRVKHRPHPCEKDIHCGHRCQENCSEDHQHTTRCRKECRQVCNHAKCRLPCSVPCAPCQEPCGWNCSHHTCPVPCGSICVRPPCDEPCPNTLDCGHRCSSLCGEDCNIQVCPECASVDKKAEVVDLILVRTLGDVLPESGTLDEMLITIPSCRHTFTAETLDGLTGMNDFYSRDQQDTKWTGLRVPLGIIKPPVCPTCRAPITCPRYGRVFKRANLDILERNVAAHMSQSLDRWQTVLHEVDENRLKASLITEASAIVLPQSKDSSAPKKQKGARNRVLKEVKEIPISERDINPANTALQTIDSKVVRIWHKAAHPLFNAYKEIVKISETRSAHVQAWEAAFSFLYEHEIQLGLEKPELMPRRPEEHALRMATLQVGQPRPLADKRFIVEAFWATLHIRLMVIRLAQVWLQEVKKRLEHYPAFHRQHWATYIDFLFRTCVRDAEKAYQIAEDSHSPRQVMKSMLLRMRIDLELFRFNLSMCEQFGTIKDQRDDLLEAAIKHGDEAAEQIKASIQAHLAGRERGLPLRQEREWIEENFTSIARVIIEEWAEIQRSIRLDTFYEPVSLDEKMQIIRAFNFGSTGHFYTCQNGHIFAIGECGGAMERSRCPECGSVIGGSSHHLDSSNRAATEFDELTRRVNSGVQEGPWQRNPY
ncbi:hypothetical protein BDZ97DRAFT_1666780 [Flammula alnicola]|nr:hypothetical protein BDZ97DRAFT_1666780 [Flammula alnicola]